ncbi:hypothetical protein [Flavitalea sp.]|nr:hypothetical protein [Flavitalea sp.]
MKRILSGVVLFLLPMTLLVFILGKAISFIQKLILPIKMYLPFQRVLGIGMLTFISLVLIILICLIAGTLSEKKLFKSLIVKIEDNLLVFIPGYSMLKSRASDAISDADNKWRSVLVSENNDWKLGIEVDRQTGGYSTIFFPGPPDPRSGIIKLVHESKLKHLNIPVSKMVRTIRKYGEGSACWVNGETHNQENNLDQSVKVIE